MEVYRMRRLVVFGGPLIAVVVACSLLGGWRINGLDLCAFGALILFVILALVDDAMVEKGRWKP